MKCYICFKNFDKSDMREIKISNDNIYLTCESCKNEWLECVNKAVELVE